MDNYSKVLTFFMENGVQLTTEQLEALKEEFLDEGALKKLVDTRTNKEKDLRDQAKKLYAIGTPQRKKQADELEDKVWDIKSAPINPKEYEYISTGDATRSYKTARHYESDRDNIRKMKNQLGQGKENMSKDREPGEYLKKQELINKYEKGKE